VAQQASGFVYCVSLTGVTGARRALSSGLGEFLARVRRHTSLPLAVGFGISQSEHVEAVANLGADAAVIGSAIIDLIDRTSPDKRAEAVRQYVKALGGRRRPSV
jgi:tryptophan synthase alpha chain